MENTKMLTSTSIHSLVNHLNSSHHEDRSWGTSPGWAARFFIKSAKSARLPSYRLTCCDSGNRSSRFSSPRKVVGINGSMLGEKSKQCWKSSGCSMKRGIHSQVSSDIGRGGAVWQANECAPKNLRRSCGGISK